VFVSLLDSKQKRKHHFMFKKWACFYFTLRFLFSYFFSLFFLTYWFFFNCQGSINQKKQTNQHVSKLSKIESCKPINYCLSPLGAKYVMVPFRKTFSYYYVLESKGYYIFSLASHASNKTKSVFLFVQRSEEKTYFCFKILLLAHPRFLFFLNGSVFIWHRIETYFFHFFSTLSFYLGCCTKILSSFVLY